MAGRVLALATATPPHLVLQDEVFDGFYRDIYAEVPNAKDLFANTQVRQRYMAWDPRMAFVGGFPPMGARMRAWEEHVLDLGRRCLTDVLHGVEPAAVGSFAMASCTGYAGPTPEMMLAKEFGLPAGLRRTFVGHMGCYAAFNVLKVALDALAARPDELVLVACAEVCSVHVRPEATAEQAVVHALFGDAGAAMLLASEDDTRGTDGSGHGPRILRTHTSTHYATWQAMTWRVEDDAFRMTLSPYVPAYLAETIRPFILELVEPAGLTLADIQHWGIHPGGPKIIEFVGDRLGLPTAALVPSQEVLAEYGNCSSTTVLLILDRLLRVDRPAPGEHGVLMAFGPGLTMEAALVQF